MGACTVLPWQEAKFPIARCCVARVMQGARWAAIGRILSGSAGFVLGFAIRSGCGAKNHLDCGNMGSRIKTSTAAVNTTLLS
jgi:hypothetical protein